MNRAYRQSASNCCRLTAGVHVTLRETDGLAICDYPLRAMRLSTHAARLLQQCREERTCEQLASSLHLPIKRVEALRAPLPSPALSAARPPPAPPPPPRPS